MEFETSILGLVLSPTLELCTWNNVHGDSDDNAPEDEEYTNVQDDTDYSIYYRLECFAKPMNVGFQRLNSGFQRLKVEFQHLNVRFQRLNVEFQRLNVGFCIFSSAGRPWGPPHDLLVLGLFPIENLWF